MTVFTALTGYSREMMSWDRMRVEATLDLSLVLPLSGP